MVRNRTTLHFYRTTTDSGLVEDTKTRTASMTINSGRRFAIFPWSIVGLDRKTQNDGAEPSEYERRVDGNFSYVMDRKLTLTGTVGWEEIEVAGLAQQPEGVTWSGGFTARPSSRTSLQFSYGDRNGQRDISFTAGHRISERTSVDATYSEAIQTSQQLLDPALPAAALTGFGLSESTFLQKVFRLNFSGSRRRNTFSGGAFWEQRDTESTGVRAINYGGNIGLTRRLSSRLDGSVGLGVQTTDFGTADDREDIDYSASTSLNYQVSNDIQATLAYNLTLTKVNNAPDDLLENAVSIGLTKNF